MSMSTNWMHDFSETLRTTPLHQTYGRVVKVVGLMVESTGPSARLGDVCELLTDRQTPVVAEVVGFRESRLLLMPMGELDAVKPGTEVRSLGKPFSVFCGQGLLGRVLDGLGVPMDGKGPIREGQWVPVTNQPPNPMMREPISQPFQTGVRVIDTLLSMGQGQRMGIFAGSGVGKSTLMSMIARNTAADVNVVALIGERGREVREFIERDLAADGLERSVVVVSTSDQPALLRLKAAFVATAVAEFFRDKGLAVNLMMDSVTRFAMAQREIGLSVGEPPTSRGYTPSVFSLLPKLLERSGPARIGSITAFYTVLVDGDDMNDPIADAVRGILDGHIVLSRDLANSGQFPAIDVLSSLSRLFSVITTAGHREAAIKVRRWLQQYRDVEDLLRIGAYRQGTDPQVDQAILVNPDVRAFLAQSTSHASDLSDSLSALSQLTGVAI